MTNTEKVHTFLINLPMEKEEVTPEYAAYATFQIMYLLWVLVGLFSSQWIFFLGIILPAFIKKDSVVYRRFDATVTFIVIISLIISKYHFS